MSRRAMLLNEDPEGSWERSGIESHKMSRSEEDGPEETAAQMFDASMTELAAVLVESREAFDVGNAVKTEGPE
jgi:hypothetical protein